MSRSTGAVRECRVLHRDRARPSCPQIARSPSLRRAYCRDAVLALLCSFALTGCAARDLTWEFGEDAPQRLTNARQVEVTNRLSIVESARLEGKDPQFFLDQIYAALRARGYANRLAPKTGSANPLPPAGGTSGVQSASSAAPGRDSGGTGSGRTDPDQADPTRLRFEFSMLISQTCHMDMIETPLSFGSPSVSARWLHRVKEITLTVRSAGNPVALGTVKVCYQEPQNDFQGPLKDVLCGVDLARQRARSGTLQLTGPPGESSAKP